MTTTSKRRDASHLPSTDGSLETQNTSIMAGLHYPHRRQTSKSSHDLWTYHIAISSRGKVGKADSVTAADPRVCDGRHQTRLAWVASSKNVP